MYKHIFYKVINKSNINILFLGLFLFVFISFFIFHSVFARPVARDSAGRSRVLTKHFKNSRTSSVKVEPVPAVIVVNEEKPAVVEEKKIDENALNEAKAIRNFRIAELKRLKEELSGLKRDSSGQCSVDGKQMSLAQYRAKISEVKSFSKSDKVAKINASILDKKNTVSSLENRISEKEEQAKKMIAGTVATSTLAVAGTAGLGVAIADLVKTKMSAKKLQNGEAVCGKYGLLVR